MFLDENVPGFYWLMRQCRHSTQCMWENGRIANRHIHNGVVYGPRHGVPLDVAIGATVADY